ncbi:MAG: citryl-CoA lyase [Alphaproteobacteria bacterium]|nr:citryl-CoA lyase [Alphaproteobacteria bacterium]
MTGDGGEVRIRTGITKVTADDIVVRGYRLTEDLVGHFSFTDAFFLQMTGRRPAERESRLFEALMVNSMEHGINHPVLVARLTHGAAPETIQAAIAAGILGMGSVGDGAIELVADLLYGLAQTADAEAIADEAAAARLVAEHRASRRIIPGLGHAMHKQADPRVGRLFALVRELGFGGRYVALMHHVASQVALATGRDLPINGAAAVAAAYCELGLPAKIAKAVTVVSICAGVTGHLMEEMRDPQARNMRRLISGATDFRPDEATETRTVKGK